MTVKELVALLQDCPQDADVVVFLPDTGNVTGVSWTPDRKMVSIDYDIDMDAQE